MSQSFELTSRYYVLLYQEKDSHAESAYVDKLLQRHGISGPNLLEFGSGTGRHGCLLASRGYRVHGAAPPWLSPPSRLKALAASRAI